MNDGGKVLVELLKQVGKSLLPYPDPIRRRRLRRHARALVSWTCWPGDTAATPVEVAEGYSRVATLTDDERDRLPDLLVSRQVIDVAFRVCRDPTTAVTQAKKLTPLRRDAEAKARELLTT